MLELVVLRHTEPEFRGTYIGGGSNPPLSRRGIHHAKKAASVLIGEKFNVLYSSCLKRTKQTLAPLSTLTGMHGIALEGLEELHFGLWEGRNWNSIEKEDSSLWKEWIENAWKTAPPRGETLRNLLERSIFAFNEITRKHTTGKVLVVSHSGPIRALLLHIMGATHRKSGKEITRIFHAMSVNYGALCRFLVPESGLPVLRQWNIPILSGKEILDIDSLQD